MATSTTSADLERVAERLAHLLALDRHPGVVEPVAREAEAGGVRLGLLVLVVREAQVDAAAVDVEGVAEVACAPSPSTRGASRDGRRRRAWPTTRWPARPPCGPSTARSRGRPSCRAGRRPPRRSMSSGDWWLSAPYSGPGHDVEVDVAASRPVTGRRGRVSIERRPSARPSRGCARWRAARRWRQDPEGVEGGGRQALVAVGQRVPGLAAVRALARGSCRRCR